MVQIFFDIETYSPHVSGPRLCDKVISIAYKIGDSDVVVLKEWELGEKAVLTRFLDVIQSQDRPNIIGHNILRFDIPVIVCRSLENGLGRLGEIYSVFREPYGIDTLQCLLPSNRMYFRGLGLAACAERLGISLASENSSSIQELYERGEYEKIVHHNVEDALVTERLYYHLMNCDFDPFNVGREIR
ncbi:MAG: ribonuclease H-like domain-containing protein [Candidatus Bathyarchaeota archaeon]|nr:ribonuclease H-like domain-containing protein [Candidatus Bathyarchaeota archaeon]